MKKIVCILIGIIGGGAHYLVYECNVAIQTLLVFMSIDYITGMVNAIVFKKSPKSKTGTLNSSVGWKGLCKKGMMILYVLVGIRLDILLEVRCVADMICIGFIINELISIIENAGLMGIPLPMALNKVVELLKEKQNKE